MSTQRFTPEFKEEAVHQVLERGYPVAEVAARLGVSTHSLHKWVKAVKPPKNEQQAAELVEAKSEILRLRAQMRRLGEERDLLKKAAVLCQGARVKYRFMNEHRHEYSLVLMCRVLKVARAGFYQWLNKPLSDRATEDKRLVEVIRNSYAASGGVYGAQRVFGDLREAGETCGKHRVERLMRVNKIKAVRVTRRHVRLLADRPFCRRIGLTVNSPSAARTRHG